MQSKETQSSPVLERSKNYAEYCTMAYQLYANRVQYLHDPFYAKHRDSGKVQDMLKEQAEMLDQPHDKHVDYISYDDDVRNVDPRKPTFYAGSVYFEPPEFAGKIGRVYHGDELVREYSDKSGQEDSIDIYTFEGSTGESTEHGGLPSTMGYVAYNRATKEITVTFRGSRSGSAGRGAIGGLFFEEGNPDWVTDMNIAGDLVENKEILVGGKVANGFATTYLSCRSGLIDIIKKIRESDPSPKTPPKLVTTGHSLGGALATMMFVDAKKGTLSQRLRTALGDKEADGVFADTLVQGTECFAFSAPPVCDAKAVKKISDQSDKFHRVYFENDPVVFGGNILRMLKGGGVNESRELLKDIESSTDVNLGKYTEGGTFNFGCPHELYLVYEKVQKKLGIPDSEMKRNWITMKDMMVTHAAKGSEPKPLNPEQAATIASQFNHEYFLTLALVMAERESHESGETELMKYIGDIGQLFKDINPYESPEKFEEFKKRLGEVTTKLQGAISNEEKSWVRYPRKVGEFMLSLLKVVAAVIRLVWEVVKGLANWFLKQGSDEIQAFRDKRLSDSIRDLNDSCSKMMNDVILPLTESFDDKKMSAKDLEEKISLCEKSLSKGLGDLEKKLSKFQKYAADSKDPESAEILKFASKLSEDFKKCLAACKSPVNLEDYQKQHGELSAAAYHLVETFSELESKVAKRSERWSTVSTPTSVKEIAANAYMTVSGLTFGLKVGLAKLLGSLRDVGYAFYNIFARSNVTKNYMSDTLGGLSKALAQTNYATLKKVKDERVKADAESIPKKADVPSRTLD